jgi:hypothetical protein
VPTSKSFTLDLPLKSSGIWKPDVKSQNDLTTNLDKHPDVTTARNNLVRAVGLRKQQ